MTVNQLMEILKQKNGNAEVTIWVSGEVMDNFYDCCAFEPVVEEGDEGFRIDLTAAKDKCIMS